MTTSTKCPCGRPVHVTTPSGSATEHEAERAGKCLSCYHIDEYVKAVTGAKP
jgi:hypothetical protein